MQDNSSKAVQIFDKLASRYQDKFMDVSRYDDTFRFFCEAITTESAEILELACGPGNVTKALLNMRPDFKILGADLAPNMVSLAKLNNPNAKFQVMDSRAISSVNKRFDGIMCSFLFPYLSKNEVQKLIADSFNILNKNGVLYLSTIEDEHVKSGFKKGSSGDEIFMNYYEADFICDTLKLNGYNLLNLIRLEYVDSSYASVIDLIIIAQKK